MTTAPGRAATPPPQAVSGPTGTDDGRWAATILARPLFSPDRRPAPVAAARPVGPGAALPRVAGIMLDGGVRRVIFAATGDGRPAVVAEGGDMNGFHVQSITSSDVTVIGPDGPRVLRPSFDPRPPAAAAGQAGPQPGFPSLTGLPDLPGLPARPAPGPALPAGQPGR